MNRRLLITTVILSALLLMPALACADDLADLKATSEKFFEAYNNKDANTMCAILHENVAVYGPEAIFVSGIVPGCPGMIDSFANTVETIQISIVNPTYRIIGNAGIVYGHRVISYKYKDGPADGNTQRFISVYIKENGKWRMVVSSMAYITVGE